jgi:hypothetical protein
VPTVNFDLFLSGNFKKIGEPLLLGGRVMENKRNYIKRSWVLPSPGNLKQNKTNSCPGDFKCLGNRRM